MHPLAARAFATAQLKGVQYADVRVCHSVEQNLSVKNGRVDGLTHTKSLGFGVRVLVDVTWGFAASRDMTTAEADRVTALAVSIARASALTGGRNTRVRCGTLNKLGRYCFGSEVVNLTADSLRPTGLGTYGWGDEGVPATSTLLVRNGLFVGYLMSRETAYQMNLPSNGCMRAEGWSRLPLVRMGNVSLELGEWTLADLIADTDEGLFLETNRSWNIDDRSYNFQFST
ncbi:MAG: metallopeptidase TldD-related protein [Anaerolineales bacterium]|nr:metallopeptidase TldD-related protein [Anaerolineales bacterium]